MEKCKFEWNAKTKRSRPLSGLSVSLDSMERVCGVSKGKQYNLPTSLFIKIDFCLYISVRVVVNGLKTPKNQIK